MPCVDKGFLIIIGGKEGSPELSSSFQSSKRYNGAWLYFDHGSKNRLLECSENTFNLYLGDRHFGSNDTAYTCEQKKWSPTQHTGTLINFDARRGLLNIQSDFLGSEPLFYGFKGGALWVSNRIENFARYGDFERDWAGVFTFLNDAYTVGERSLLKHVFLLRPLQRVTYNVITETLETKSFDYWKSDSSADVESVLDAVDERLNHVLCNSPHTSLMLSAGWDSRLLLSSNPERIVNTYTHGHLASREIAIAFQLGSPLQKSMSFEPLENTPFGRNQALEMLAQLGSALFPHWYFASSLLNSSSEVPLSAGLFVEHLSGHYGYNSLGNNRSRLVAFFNTILRPNVYDKIDNEQAIKQLTPLLSKGFVNHPWCWKQDIDSASLRANFNCDVEQVLQNYTRHKTSGLHELSERYRLEHSHRQFFVLQTKAAENFMGYHHPYADSRLAELVLQLKFRHRVNYKVSQNIVKRRVPQLLKLPMAATLVNAKRPILMQEFSRFARIAYEKVNNKLAGKVVKGLGWNNFEFLFSTDTFHEYIDLLVDDMWDKAAMHSFVKNAARNNVDAYSMLEMLTKCLTLDFRLNPNAYEFD
tara:strand:- start:17675 stop:19435 length:1761 start_codon:yes stop_codon:yes gene_type:complete